MPVRSAAMVMLIIFSVAGGTTVALGQVQPKTTYNSSTAQDAPPSGPFTLTPGARAESGSVAPSSDQLRGSVFDARTGRVRPGNPSPSVR